MSNIFRATMLAACAVLGLGALSAARADVIRVAVVTVDNASDFQANSALVPELEALLKKAAGVKAVYAGSDAEHMAITTTSVWGSAADATALTGSADWKAAAGKLKSKSYTVGIFELVP